MPHGEKYVTKPASAEHDDAEADAPGQRAPTDHLATAGTR